MESPLSIDSYGIHTDAINQSASVLPVSWAQQAVLLTPDIRQVMAQFWGIQPLVRFLSVSDTPHYYWHLEDFYVAQKGLDKHGKRWAQLRLSQGLCQFLFERTLGHSIENQDFTLADIHNFEVFVLERFSRQLFQCFSPALIQPPPKYAPPVQEDTLIHFVWVLQGEPEQVNQIVLTLPQICVRTVLAEEKAVWSLPDSLFEHLPVDVNIKVGSTRVKLDDLQQLEQGDVLLLENSKHHTWYLGMPGKSAKKPFDVQLPTHLRISDLWMQQGWTEMNDMSQTPKSIWDNLEVEVTAAFNPIKMPLKQIKELEQGLVLEVGDLMDHKIKIEVEGHAVAWGELLVIGDKFGVRVQGLQAEVESSSVQKILTGTTITSSNKAEPVKATVPEPMSKAIAESRQEPTDSESETDDFLNMELEDSDFDDLDSDEDWT